MTSGAEELTSVPGAPRQLGHGPVRNTLFQLSAQLTSAAFTAGLALYLVRALGPEGYGALALAVSVSGLVLLPADFGLSAAVARFVAEKRDNPRLAAAVLARGLQMKLIAGALASIALFAAAPAIAHAYGDAHLVWPLRWISIAVFGQGLVYFLNSAFAAARTVSRSLTMYTVESATETGASIALVVAGAGIAGAALGKAIGYAVGGLAGLLLTIPLLGRFRHAWRNRRTVPVRGIAQYASAMMIVDAAHTAIVQIDVLMIGAILTVGAAGPFAAVTRLFLFLTYFGTAVAAGVAPRLSRTTTTEPDTATFIQGLRYMILIQGVLLAPLVVWAKPIVAVVLGSGYQGSIGVMQALAPTAVLGGLAPVLALGVNYLGEARRRVPMMLGVLVIGVVSTYFLIEAVGIVGAAIADDLVLLAHVAAHTWICGRLIEIDFRSLGLALARTLLAAAAMAAALAVFGVGRLSPVAWIVGATVGTTVYAGALVALREVSVAEIRMVWKRALGGLRRLRTARSRV